MGTNAAQTAKTIIENSFQVMSIHYMAIVQAVDYLKIQDKLSTKGKEIYDEIRTFFPVFIEDTPFYEDIERMTEFLKGYEMCDVRYEMCDVRLATCEKDSCISHVANQMSHIADQVSHIESCKSQTEIV